MLRDALNQGARLLEALLTNPAYFWRLAAIVILADVVFTHAIVRFVPYTEIDWTTYMAQVDVYLSGIRDYSLIEGPTGPLVYPAGHVYIYRFLHFVTDSGSNLQLAQNIFTALYAVSLVLSCAIYRQTKVVPNWIILLFPLSKRLHSIFVLRLFNDCWAVVVMQTAVLSYQNGWDDIGTFLFSMALSIKMCILLYLPGLLAILFKRGGLLSTLRHSATIVLAQVLFASPFLRENASSYLQRSFDFGRIFLYKWTVNWRFVKEETFLSPLWATGLLVGQAAALIAFGLWRWFGKDGGVWVVVRRGLQRPRAPAGVVPVTANDIAMILFTSNLIGILFARSLHYQFYAWYAQQLPFLVWKTPYPLVLKFAVLLCIEYAWNVFPSTRLSSAILLCANTCLLVGIWES